MTISFVHMVAHIFSLREKCDAGYYTDAHRYEAAATPAVTESHIRATKEDDEERRGGRGLRLRARIKLSRVYISHTLFNFTTSRFNSDDGFSTITRPYFSPRSPAIQRSSYLSFSPSSEFSLFLSFFTPASGTAHHFVNQDKLEISSREIQPRYRLRLGGIYWATTVYPAVPTRY